MNDPANPEPPGFDATKPPDPATPPAAVAQPSPAASSRTVPVRASDAPQTSAVVPSPPGTVDGTPTSGSAAVPAASSGGVPPRQGTPRGTPGEPAAATAALRKQTSALHPAPDPLVSGFHFRGVLPHLKREGGTYFVTFREAGTLPREVLLRFKQERDAILQQALAAKRPLTWHEREELFRWYSSRVDRYLDAGHGPCHLRQPEFAGLVADALRFFEGQRCELRAWVVMPNHVHAVVWPMPGHTLSAILHSWKSFTAHEINRRLPARLVPFWQSESYEHLIRDNEDLHRCCHYTVMNPVHARLCARPEDWPWSSAHVAQPSPAAGSRGVPPREGTRGATPREPAGGDACATTPDTTS